MACRQGPAAAPRQQRGNLAGDINVVAALQDRAELGIRCDCSLARFDAQLTGHRRLDRHIGEVAVGLAVLQELCHAGHELTELVGVHRGGLLPQRPSAKNGELHVADQPRRPQELGGRHGADCPDAVCPGGGGSGVSCRACRIVASILSVAVASPNFSSTRSTATFARKAMRTWSGVGPV